jgi:hypothetical protein
MSWAVFGADTEWLAMKAVSETNGRLLNNQIVSVLSPVVTGSPLS